MNKKPYIGQPLRKGYRITEGLGGYWPFIEAGNLVDFSFERNDGTLTDVTWSGEGLDFNGGTSEITLGVQKFGIDTTQEFTISIWCNFNTLTNSDAVCGRSAFVRPWDIFVNANGSVSFRSRTTGLITSTSVAGSVTADGQWYHIAGTFTVSLQSLYINGVLADSDAPTGGSLNFVNDTTDTTIGTTLAPNSFDGKCRNASLYNRTLSASEIQQLYINPNLPIQTTPIWMFFQEAAGGDIGGLMQQIRGKSGGKQNKSGGKQ